MVFKDNKLFMVAGANGGPMIITSTLQVDPPLLPSPLPPFFPLPFFSPSLPLSPPSRNHIDVLECTLAWKRAVRRRRVTSPLCSVRSSCRVSLLFTFLFILFWCIHFYLLTYLDFMNLNSRRIWWLDYKRKETR